MHGYEATREAAMAASPRAGGGSSSKIGKPRFRGQSENRLLGLSLTVFVHQRLFGGFTCRVAHRPLSQTAR
jgi:hypothetical protein